MPVADFNPAKQRKMYLSRYHFVLIPGQISPRRTDDLIFFAVKIVCHDKLIDKPTVSSWSFFVNRIAVKTCWRNLLPQSTFVAEQVSESEVIELEDKFFPQSTVKNINCHDLRL